MKFKKSTLLIPILSVVLSAHAISPSPTVYSGAILTMGGNSTIYGNLQVAAAATLGATSTVGGDLIAGGALTLGTGGNVGGDLISGAAIAVGTASTIEGDLKSLSTVGLGAQASVSGKVIAGTTLTLGAFVTIGPTSDANGEAVNAQAGTSASISATATVNGSILQGQELSDVDAAEIKSKMTDWKDKLAQEQDRLAQEQDKLGRHQPKKDLPLTIAVDTTLEPGVYHASALTTAAGITLTFDASDPNNKRNAKWIINVDTSTSLGANLKMVFKEGSNGTIIFNSGSHTTIGAGSTLIGTFFTNTNITTGAGIQLTGEASASTGIGKLCGGLFSTNGAITLGADNQIGSKGCKPYFESTVSVNSYAGTVRRPINLRGAEEFTILAKTGITNIGNHHTKITGNIGSSPIAANFMDNVYCTEISEGTIYGVDASYAGGMGGTACSLGNADAKTQVDNAVLDMVVAYTDAAGRASPDYSEYGAGKISDGQTLKPGLYRWGTNVVMDQNITFKGGKDDVWIFQISGNLYQAGATKMILNGALAKNIFWQLTENVALGDNAQFVGVVLAKTHIALNPLAKVNGRLLSQTQVTLQDNIVNPPTAE